jgi:peptide chain release factor 3
VYERAHRHVRLYAREGRAAKSVATTVPLDDAAALTAELGADAYAQLLEDAEMLDELTSAVDIPKIHAGEQAPVFFGSARSAFAVDVFLDSLLELGAAPRARPALTGGSNADGSTVGPESQSNFCGFVFKQQANLDPRHRDRMAFVRIISGRYTKGLKVKNSRLKGSKEIALSAATSMMANDQTSVEVAYPGDVIGVPNTGAFAIGDTLYTGTTRVALAPVPTFSPEVFAYCRSMATSDYKKFSKGTEQLLGEGAVQMLRDRGDDGSGQRVVAAVGELQFEVFADRMLNEYACEVRLERMAYQSCRWADSWAAVDAAKADNKLMGVLMLEDAHGRPVLLFPTKWKREAVEKDAGLALHASVMAPDSGSARR